MGDDQDKAKRSIWREVALSAGGAWLVGIAFFGLRAVFLNETYQLAGLLISAVPAFVVLRWGNKVPA